MATINLDKFEILWLCEGAIGKSHLRWGIYDKMVNEVYPVLSEEEREFVYMYLKRDTAWHWTRRTLGDDVPYKYWQQMLARFNPANQYKVTVQNKKDKQVCDAYLFDGKYYTGWTRYCNEDYIKKVEHKPFKKCINKWCGSKDECSRFCLHPTLDDKIIDGAGNWACSKCDFIINKEGDCEIENQK